MNVILFGAPWCPSCQVFRPMVEETCADANVSLKYLDVDQYFDIAGLYGVKTIPAMVVQNDSGREVLHTGSCSREELIERLLHK